MIKNITRTIRTNIEDIVRGKKLMTQRRKEYQEQLMNDGICVYGTTIEEQTIAVLQDAISFCDTKIAEMRRV